MSQKPIDLLKAHGHLINSLLHTSVEYAALFLMLLPKCTHCFARPATVVHNYIGEARCDLCCARAVWNDKEPENVWLDYPYAAAVRHVQDHIEESPLVH